MEWPKRLHILQLDDQNVHSQQAGVPNQRFTLLRPYRSTPTGCGPAVSYSLNDIWAGLVGVPINHTRQVVSSFIRESVGLEKTKRRYLALIGCVYFRESTVLLGGVVPIARPEEDDENKTISGQDISIKPAQKKRKIAPSKI